MGCYGNTTEASKTPTTEIEAHSLNLWKMFPNPAKESLILSNLPNNSCVEIFDITGKKLFSSVVNNEQTIFNTTHFESGVYFIQVIDNGVVSNRKFVIGK